MLEKSAGDSVCDRARGGIRRTRGGIVPAGMAVLAMSLAGCSHLPSVNWPWHRKPAPPPPQVHELVETTDAGTAASFPQYWLRNTLIVDLQGATGTGGVLLKPREGTTWPVRLAFRVMPGSIGELEIRAQQRTVLPVTAAGTKPILLELSPGIYVPKTEQIAVSWGPNPIPTP
jgi:hypothetical protein